MSGHWPQDNSETKPGLPVTSWLPIPSLGNSASGIHIKRSWLLDEFWGFIVGLFVWGFFLDYWQISCMCINPPTIWEAVFLTHWKLLCRSHCLAPSLSEDPTLQGLPDTPFTFLWMWHSSRRARDPLLGLCCRSARGSASSFARQKLPMWGPDELWGVLQVFSVYKAHAKAKQKSREQWPNRNHINWHFWTPKCWLA